MIAHLIRALFRAADRVIDAHVAAALDDPEPAPTWGDYGYRTGRAASPADLAYHELVSELVLDHANEAWTDCGGVLLESWLLLNAPEGIDR